MCHKYIWIKLMFMIKYEKWEIYFKTKIIADEILDEKW
jgi:hypothetical protein